MAACGAAEWVEGEAVARAALSAVVFMERARGALTYRVGALLLALALLAVFAAVLHMETR